MTDRYTDRRGRVHRVIHSQWEQISPENRQRITEELVRILTAREKEKPDGNRPVRKEIR